MAAGPEIRHKPARGYKAEWSASSLPRFGRFAESRTTTAQPPLTAGQAHTLCGFSVAYADVQVGGCFQAAKEKSKFVRRDSQFAG